MRDRRGFTLIELSVVLVVIGLIAGGVIVGRELIEKARLRGTLSDFEKYSAAMNAFRLKYDCTAGDCPNATRFGLGTAGGVGDDGDGDGMVFSDLFFFSTNHGPAMKETLNLWYHLAEARMAPGRFTGYDGFASFSGDSNGYAPAARAGVNSFVWGMSITDTSAGDASFGNSWVLWGVTNNGLASAVNSLTAPQAYWIDEKLDDGLPDAGIVRPVYNYSGPRVVDGRTSCSLPIPPANVRWQYDLKGLWQDYANAVPQTPPNPEKIACSLAVSKAW